MQRQQVAPEAKISYVGYRNNLLAMLMIRCYNPLSQLNTENASQSHVARSLVQLKKNFE